ncbi:MAG: DNA repair protein RecO [Candidatus Omnitrophota bacterium]
MAIQTTEAFVLGRRDFRETSILAVFYSRDFGKIKGIIKGIRSEKSRYGSLVELFGLNKIVFYEKSKSEFSNVTQCDLIEGFFGIQKNLSAIAHASYLCELLDAMTEPSESNVEIYELLYNSFKALSAGEDANKVTRVFELRLLSHLGMAPSLKECVCCAADISAAGAKFSFNQGGMLCENCLSRDPYARTVKKGTIETLNHIKKSKLESLLRLKISKSIEDELGAFVGKLLESHLDKPLKSKKFLEEVRRLTK